MGDSASILIAGNTPGKQLVGEASAWVQEMPQYAKRIEGLTVGDVTTYYKAWAPYGTAEGDPDWMIVRLVLDVGTELEVTEGIAGGAVNLFNYSWAGRAGHAYS